MKRAYMGYYSDSEEVPENAHLQHQHHPPPIIEEDECTEKVLNSKGITDNAEVNKLA
jgi:hypothetical protein